MKVGEGVIPLHSTWRHQRKVRKISRITMRICVNSMNIVVESFISRRNITTMG